MPDSPCLRRAFSLIGYFLATILVTASAGWASDYGTTGLIDTPTARMHQDGELALSFAYDGRQQAYMFTYQAFPWLEGTFRYSGFERFFNWDRNYEIKARILEESYYLPQISIGIRDAVGTGLFGSEYVVASKQIGQWDAHLGVGWGRLAGDELFDNPLSMISGRFDTRNADSGVGGELALDDFFSGEQVGLFGGLEYQMASYPVKLIAEYNPDRYDYDFAKAQQPTPSSPVSVGAEWEPFPGVKLAVSYQHGDDFGVSITSILDSSQPTPVYPAPIFQSTVDVTDELLPAQIKRQKWYDRLLYDMERAGLVLVSATLYERDGYVQLVVGNLEYAQWRDALDRIRSLADLHLPPYVRTMQLIIEEAGHRVHTIVTPRPSTFYSAEPEILARYESVLPPRMPGKPQFDTGFFTNRINMDFNLDNRLQLFDPDDPARYQIYLNAGLNYTLNKSWSIQGNYRFDITNNFDESRRKTSNSQLPKVRSDIVKYLIEGESGVESLYLDGRGSLASGLHYRAYAGVLETMYSGVGVELLYQPFQSRLAYGLSANRVRQRDFDGGLDHLDYEVTTAFVSAYWASPFYNYDIAVHAGQYLAEDVGGTFEVRRTFDNGWQVGVWATFTDVPAEVFGEGSFDKGFFFRVPLNTVFNRNTRGAFATRIRPIQRDGGQRLENHSGTLWWDLREARYDVFVNSSSRGSR